MKDEDKTKEQLIAELEELSQRVTEFEAIEAKQIGVEPALKQAEQEKQTILDSLVEHVVYHDLEMRILWANRAACESVGRTREELLGLHCYEIWAERSDPCEDCPVKLARETGQPQAVEKMTPDGRFWFIQGSLVRDSNGDIVGMVELTLDITERMRAEEALRKAHGELGQRVEERTAELLETNEQLKHQIEERKQVEEALRSAHGRLRATFDAIQDNMNIVDLDFYLADVNEVLIKAFGLSDRESVLGRKCFEVLKGQKDICSNCAVAEVYRTKAPAYRTSTSEDEVLTAGKSFEIFAYPIMDEHGNLSGAVEFARDITDRKLAEEALQRAHDELEQRVEERTAQLVELNEKLKQEIEERKQVEQELRKREAELEIQTNELEEVNSALRVLLKRRDEDKTELEEKVLSSVKELVVPYVERLKKSKLDAKQTAYVSILESNLNDIVSPFAHKLSSKYLSLTPREIQIANLVKQGRTTKEIAEILNSSDRTVEFHRKNIRRKIGIVNRKMNLRSHLLSM